MQVKYYKVIAYYETNFQKFLLDNIVSKYFADIEIAYFNHTGQNMRAFNCNKPVSLDFWSKLLPSWKAILCSQVLYQCDILIGPLITSRSSLFFVSYINFNKLFLYDDGIGTPLILMNPEYYLGFSCSSYMKQKLNSIIMRLFIKRKMLSVNEITNLISTYYTIFKNDLPINTLHINPFKNRTITIMMKSVGFIGQPLIELKYLSKEEYIIFLKNLISKYKRIKYYLHPQEKWYVNYKIDGLKFIQTNMNLEDYFEKNGVPEVLLSSHSTALINLKLINPNIKCYYIESTFKIPYKHLYYQILSNNDVEKYNFDIGVFCE